MDILAAPSTLILEEVINDQKTFWAVLKNDLIKKLEGLDSHSSMNN